MCLMTKNNMKQNYVSAIAIFICSILSLFVGYLVADIETNEAEQSFSSIVKSNYLDGLSDARFYVDILYALREDNAEIVEELLQIRAKSLVNNSDRNYEMLENLFGEGVGKQVLGKKLDDRLIRRALEYQNKYCSDKCLGL